MTQNFSDTNLVRSVVVLTLLVFTAMVMAFVSPVGITNTPEMRCGQLDGHTICL